MIKITSGDQLRVGDIIQDWSRKALIWEIVSIDKQNNVRFWVVRSDITFNLERFLHCETHDFIRHTIISR